MIFLFTVTIVCHCGAALAQNSKEVQWLGSMAYGGIVERQIEPMYIPVVPSEREITVNKSILVGLRKDGVVVWRETVPIEVEVETTTPFAQ